MASGSARGATLLEVLPALALLALVSATAIPVVAGTLERERTIAGARFVAARIVQAQLEALRRGAAVALRFEVAPGGASLQLFLDRNGNGVSTSDIANGIDIPIAPADEIGVHAQGVSIRINQRVLDAGGTQWLDAGSDPLRIGSSSFLSCSSTGSLNGGTIYVAAARGPQMAVRVTGSTGRVRVLRFEPSSGAWMP